MSRPFLRSKSIIILSGKHLELDKETRSCVVEGGYITSLCQLAPIAFEANTIRYLFKNNFLKNTRWAISLAHKHRPSYTPERCARPFLNKNNSASSKTFTDTYYFYERTVVRNKEWTNHHKANRIRNIKPLSRATLFNSYSQRTNRGYWKNLMNF